MTPVLTRSAARDLALAILAALALYAISLHHPYQYDDKHAVLYNQHIRSLDNVPSFFHDLQTFSSDRQGAMFRPLLLTSYALNYAVHGQRPSGYRLVNTILHGVCTWLVGMVVAILCGRSVAVFTAALFAVHPVHAEAIHMISGRSDLLAALGVLAGLYFFLRQRGNAAVGALGFGLLAKSTTIVLPAFAVAHDLWRGVVWRWRRHLPMAVVAGVYIVVLYGVGFLASAAGKSPRGLGVNLLTQVKSLPYYTWLFVQPVSLSVDHQFFVSSSVWRPQVLLAAAFTLSVAFIVWRGWRLPPALGATWGVLALLPTLLVPLNILVSERRAYLALLAFCLLLAWAWRLLQRRRRSTAGVLATAVVAVLALLTVSRSAVWSSEVRLWEDAVRGGPGAYRARVNLAMAYDNDGREIDAERQLQAAVDINPGAGEAWSELGVLRHRQGDLEAAEAAYRKSIAGQPMIAGVHYNLGNVLLDQKSRAADQGDMPRAHRLVDEALASYQRALELDPTMADIYNNLGVIYRDRGEPDRAMDAYERAVELNPGLIQVWFNLGVLAVEAGQPQRGAEALQTFVRVAGDDPVAAPFVVRAGELLAELGVEQ